MDFLVSSPFYSIPRHNWPMYSSDGFLIMASEIGVVAMILCCTFSLETRLVYFYYDVSFLVLHSLLLFSNRQGCYCCSIIFLLNRYICIVILLYYCFQLDSILPYQYLVVQYFTYFMLCQYCTSSSQVEYYLDMYKCTILCHTIVLLPHRHGWSQR